MGRRKIEICRIQDRKSRNITFKKRKIGLMKKAIELSILCDCEIALMVFGQDAIYQFSSSNMDTLIDRYMSYSGPVHTVGTKELDTLLPGKLSTNFQCHMKRSRPHHSGLVGYEACSPSKQHCVRKISSWPQSMTTHTSPVTTFAAHNDMNGVNSLSYNAPTTTTTSSSSSSSSSSSLLCSCASSSCNVIVCNDESSLSHNVTCARAPASTVIDTSAITLPFAGVFAAQDSNVHLRVMMPPNTSSSSSSSPNITQHTHTPRVKLVPPMTQQSLSHTVATRPLPRTINALSTVAMKQQRLPQPQQQPIYSNHSRSSSAQTMFKTSIAERMYCSLALPCGVETCVSCVTLPLSNCIDTACTSLFQRHSTACCNAINATSIVADHKAVATLSDEMTYFV